MSLARQDSFPGDYRPKTKLQWREVRAGLVRDFAGRCAYCEKPITAKSMHIDHAIPRCQGGTDHYANLHASCPRCNMSKGGRSVWQWTDPGDWAKRDQYPANDQ